MRVVSLVPSTTETLLAWGIMPVGCTRFCEQPDLHHVGGTKDPDLSAVVALAPDLVVMDEEENRRPDAEALRAAGIAVHVTAVRSLDDVGPMLAELASAVGIEPVPTIKYSSSATESGRHRSAFIPIWKRPWMTFNSNTYGSSVLAAIGIHNVFGDSATAYPEMSLDDVRARRPDLVILPSEPYPFAERHIADLAQIADDVRLIDGRDLFWWGVRTAGALNRLRAALA
jgi:ABC-type Fe3+-hydroxamate transport system substrate-binding protein